MIIISQMIFSSVAAARLTGDASLTYSSYNGSADDLVNPGRRNSSASSSFVQNYSLLHSSSGPVYNSRVGYYDVSLGYNWTSINTSFTSSTQKDDDYNASRGHLLYNGEINLDPKEIPVKLKIYSRDLTRNSISYSGGNRPQNFSSIFANRDQATDINDGLHIETGVTLVAGVKNGMTNGYNETLRHFPMILIDYKDMLNRDLLSLSPVDDRLRRLAFVSLNKKDNWFHYRHTLYENNFNSLDNYVENQVQLGTIDQYMNRRWIDFSNWLKVSTDIQFSKRKRNDQANPIEESNLNLFLVSERMSWNSRVFATFNRYSDENNNLSYQADLPLYASGVINKDLSWNARTALRDNRDIDAFGAQSTFSNKLFGYRVDAFKRAKFSLSQSLDVESSQTNLSDLLTLSGTLESASSTHFSRIISLAASYNIKKSMTSSDTASSSDFMENRLDLSLGYSPSNTFRVDVRQNSTLTKGNVNSFVGTTRNAETLLNQYVNPLNLTQSEVGSESFHSISTVMVSWTPKPRLNTYLSVNEDIFKSAVLGTNFLTEVVSGVSFANDSWSLNDRVKYNNGDRLDFENNLSSISNDASLKYTHSRSLNASLSTGYLKVYSKTGPSHETSFEQRLNYNYFSRTGSIRKLIEFSETLMYSTGSANTNRPFNNSLTLGVNYYPISQLRLSGSVGYSYPTSTRDYTLVGNASATANFRLLQASLDYMHGIRKTDGARESKFTGNIRKSF